MKKLSNSISSTCTCTARTDQNLIPEMQLFTINTITAPTDDYHTLLADYTLLSCIFHNLTSVFDLPDFFNFNLLVLFLSVIFVYTKLFSDLIFNKVF